MKKLLSERVERIEPSATFAVKAKARALQKKGIDVISFGIGEPDFDTPRHIKDAAKKALDEGFTKYTAAAGIPELREAIAEKLKHDNSIDCAAENVVVCNGAKHALANIFQAMLNPGDEVIVLAPYWVSYLEQIKLAGGIPKVVETNSSFQPQLDAISAAITDKTKILLLNSPCNPTGAVYPKETLQKIAAIAAEKDLYIISDECYEHFLYGDAQHYSIASSSETAGRTITVNALSKTYAMTGWRVGYASAPLDLAKAISSLQGQTTSNVNSIAQKAAIAALQGSQDSVKEMVSEFDKRRKVSLKAFGEMEGVNCSEQLGAFYHFPDISALYKGNIKDSLSFADFLLEKANVAIVPGSAFGRDSCMRFSYASPMEAIEKGLGRINEAIKAL